MNWFKKIASRQQIYDVFISKDYFPKELWNKDIAKEDFEQWKIQAVSRDAAAKLAWDKHGKRLLELMGPRKTKLPRKISLYVSNPELGSGGLPGRLMPILVYRGN